VKFQLLTVAAGMTALSFAGAISAQQSNPTRVGVQDPLDGSGMGSYNVLGGSRDQVGSASAFNPAISVILDGVYRNNFSGEIEDPAGFEGGHDHGHGHGHGHGGSENGFSLRETEIALSGSIDNYFDALVVLAIQGSSVELEEAYFTTNSLPAGLQIKGGRFLSDIGYINRQHVHDWDFADRPLVNEFLFGDHGLQENGLQFSWVPPTPFYSRLGVEVLQGEGGVASHVGDERYEVNVTTVRDSPTPGQSTFVRNRARADTGFDSDSGPRLFTGFLKVAPDLGFSHAAQFGVSGGFATSWQRQEAHSTRRLETWDGDAWFAGLDAVYKYDSGRSFGVGNVTVQGEYFYREIDVDYQSRQFQGPVGDQDFVVTNNGADQSSGKLRQDGAYLQTVYGFAPRWNVGVRAEALGLFKNDSFDDREFQSFDTSYKYSAQVSFMPTEFSRLRLQTNYKDYAHDHDDDHHGGAWTVMLQYNLSLGAHGAHNF